VRKSGIILSLWTALLCFPLSSFALGLGEIEVNSYLNQPLKADIEVVAARPGEIDDLLVSLASRDAFRKAGLERSSDLSKLRFKIEKSEDGQSAKILITTKSAIKEPFLNFLVEADWAKGRLLREYTVLLDPPHFAQQVQQAAPRLSSEPAAETQPAPSAQPESQQMGSMGMEAEAEAQPQPIALTEQTAQPMAEQEPASDYTPQSTYSETAPVENEFVVTRGDTLWGIASRLKDDYHSMAQVMLAIQAANPDAFARDNINNLKVGAVIRAPNSAMFDDLSKQQAYAQVLEQNGLWDDYVARKTGRATAGSPMADTTALSEPTETESGQLSLLAPGSEDSTTASMTSDDSADANQLRKQLALAEEELEASRLENQDLQSRVSDLENQLKKVEELQKIVQITDNSMAQLQQQASEQETTEVAATVTEESSSIIEEQPSDVMIDAAEKIAAEEAGQPLDSTEQSGDMMVEEATSEDVTDSMSTEAETVLPTLPEQDMQQTDDGMMADEGSDAETEMVPAPAPVIVTEAQDGILDTIPSVDSLLGDPIVLGGIAAIVLLLLGLLLVRRRKSSEPDQGIIVEEPEDSLIDDDATPIHVPTGDEVETPEAAEDEGLADTASMLIESAEEDEDEFARTAVISEVEAPQTEELAAGEPEQDDVLNEVDVYLAYGLYENAEDLLRENLENTPDRADYRAKLLDTFFATRNKDQFIKEAEALKSLGGAADRYWNRVQIMGYELAPENDLFAGAQDSDLSVADLEFAKPETADFDIGADDEITDYSNTDFDLGVDTENFEPVDPTVVKPKVGEVAETQAMESPVLDDFSETKVDNELDLPELESEDEELPDEIGDFDLDLGEDELPASDAEDLDLLNEEIEGAEGDDDALSFDLPDDLDLSTGVEDMADEADLIDLDDTAETPGLDKQPEAEDDDIVLELDSGDEIELEEVDVELDEESEKAGTRDGFNDTDEINLADIVLDEPEDSSQTVVMNADDLKTEDEESDLDLDVEETQDTDSALDLDMSDFDSAELQTGTFSPSDVEDYTPEEDDDDVTEFRPADMTGEFEVPSESDVHEEVDPDAGIEKTGTFAPGDFTDEELDNFASLEDDMGDIEDLMLPDDVDEVATKLDLAKAFIDMGDAEGARSSLEEVLSEGSQEQKAEATGLLAQIK
jgi:pilus assembly protein FimV